MTWIPFESEDLRIEDRIVVPLNEYSFGRPLFVETTLGEEGEINLNLARVRQLNLDFNRPRGNVLDATGLVADFKCNRLLLQDDYCAVYSITSFVPIGCERQLMNWPSCNWSFAES